MARPIVPTFTPVGQPAQGLMPPPPPRRASRGVGPGPAPSTDVQGGQVLAAAGYQPHTPTRQELRAARQEIADQQAAHAAELRLEQNKLKTAKANAIHDAAVRGEIPVTEARKKLKAMGFKLDPGAGEISRSGFVIPQLGAIGLTQNWFSGAVRSAAGIPGGVKALVTHPIRTGEAIGHDYAERYGPLLHGDFDKFGHQFYADPFSYTADAAALVGGTATALGKAGALGKVSALDVPATRVLRHVDEAGDVDVVQPAASPNPLTRAIEHRIDRFSEKHPNARVVGARDRVSRRQPFEAERDRVRAVAAGRQALKAATVKEPRTGLAGLVADTFDASNNITKAAALYAKGGYIPSNLVGDAIFATIHQGVFLPANLARAAGIIGKLRPETLKRLDAEVGSGPAMGLANQGPLAGAVNKVAEFSDMVSSRLFRRAAEIHELRKHGYNSDTDISYLLDAARRDKTAKATLNQISETAEKAMVVYRGMSPTERAVISRVIWIYPWIKGATRYGGRQLVDRPVRTDVLANLGDQGDKQALAALGRIVSYLENIVPFGDSFSKLGVTGQKVVKTGALSPYGTAADFGAAIVGADGKSLGQFATPAVKAGVEMAYGFNTFTGQPYPAGTTRGEIAKSALVDSLPLARLVGGLVHPQYQSEPFNAKPVDQPNYLPATSAGEARMNAVKSFLLPGFLNPAELNLTAARAKGAAEADAGAAAPDRHLRDALRESRRFARELGLPGVPQEIKTALTFRRDLDTALAKAQKAEPKGVVLTNEAKARLLVETASSSYASVGDLTGMLSVATNEQEWGQVYDRLRSALLRPLSAWNTALAHAQEQKALGTTPRAGAPADQLEPGNIDLAHRPVVHNPDGTISTVRSITIEQDGRYVLIPTVVGDSVVSDAAAIDHYKRTGEQLGVFATAKAADAYAEQLHEQQAKAYAGR